MLPRSLTPGNIEAPLVSHLKQRSCEVLFRPLSPELRFLPEGPYACGPNAFSWLAIQHGADARTGSLNVFDLASSTNQSYPLEGRPGFAFATDQPNTFVIGLERQLRLFNTATSAYTDLSEAVDSTVEGTIINDGVAFEHGLIFGCKDLEFETPKAGLYFWRRKDRRLFQLRGDQTCSNGKVIWPDGRSWTLLDIDTPKKTVVAYPLDVEGGELGEGRVVLDLRGRDDFPDGMIATPDRQSVIIAFYNPQDVACGEAVQFNLATSEPEAVWTTAKSPRVTCPQLIHVGDEVKLLLTTAAENMTPEQIQQHVDAGSLFLGDTDFAAVSDQPALVLDED